MGGTTTTHGFFSVGTGPQPARGLVISPRLREHAVEEMATVYTEGGLLCLGSDLWWIQLLNRDWEAAFVLKNRFLEVNDKTCWLPQFFPSSLTLCSENLPVRPWLPSLSVVEPDTLTTEKRERTCQPLTHKNTVVSHMCQWMNLHTTGP